METQLPCYFTGICAVVFQCPNKHQMLRSTTLEKTAELLGRLQNATGLDRRFGGLCK